MAAFPAPAQIAEKPRHFGGVLLFDRDDCGNFSLARPERL
jgi:hypothetical protein